MLKQLRALWSTYNTSATVVNVEGHTSQGQVDHGSVSTFERVGDACADVAAGLGSRFNQVPDEYCDRYHHPNNVASLVIKRAVASSLATRERHPK
jgi:hypothetical protein